MVTADYLHGQCWWRWSLLGTNRYRTDQNYRCNATAQNTLRMQDRYSCDNGLGILIDRIEPLNWIFGIASQRKIDLALCQQRHLSTRSPFGKLCPNAQWEIPMPLSHSPMPIQWSENKWNWGIYLNKHFNLWIITLRIVLMVTSDRDFNLNQKYEKIELHLKDTRYKPIT